MALITIIINGCSTNTQRTGWDNDNLKGKVKSTTEIRYNAIKQFGVIKAEDHAIFDGIGNIQFIYNRNGNLIELNQYNDTVLLFKNVFKTNQH